MLRLRCRSRPSWTTHPLPLRWSLQGIWVGEDSCKDSTQRAWSSDCSAGRAVRLRDVEAAKELQGMGLASPGADAVLSQPNH